MTSLAVLDPSPLFRASLAALVGAMGFGPVLEAADLDELARGQGEAPRPDLMLIGLPPAAAAIAPLMQAVRAWAPEARTVFVAPALDTQAMIAGFTAGAHGYLVENISREGLRHSLRLVSAGESVFPTELANALGAFSLPPRGSAEARRELRELRATEREIEVLRCLAGGESNSGIAARLGMSETAVSANIRHILRKLEVSNRTQAALWAVARGLAPLVEPPGPGAEARRRRSRGGPRPEEAPPPALGLDS